MKELSYNKTLKIALAQCMLICLLMFFAGCHNVKVNPAERIIIEVQLPPDLVYQKPANITIKENMEVQYLPISHLEYNPVWGSAKSKVFNRVVKWTLYSKEPIQVNYGFGTLCLVSPGDVIHISDNGKGIVYSGRGVEKLNMWNQIKSIEEKLQKPSKYSFKINSFEEFRQWSNYEDNKLAQQIRIIEAYRDSIRPIEYSYLKAMLVNSAENERTDAFSGLRKYIQDKSGSGLNASDLNVAWDSISVKPWGKWLRTHSYYYGSISEIYAFNRLEVLRRFSFDGSNDSLHNKETRAYLYYCNAKQNYKGLLRERLLFYIIEEPIISELGTKNPIAQMVLKDYYDQPGFPEYKKYVKEIERKAD